MNSRAKQVLLPVIAMAMTLGLIASACSPEEVDGEGPALGRITGVPAASEQSPQADKPAPDFQFQDPEGRATSLSDLQGKPVLINFWATWCDPCVYEMPFIQQVYDEWSDRGLVVLAINVGESSATVKRFLQSHSLSFPVLLDTEKAVTREYNVRGYPTTFLIDKEGVIVGYKVGPFQSKEEIEAGIRMVLP